MPLFQTLPKPDPSVVDRAARDRAAFLLRWFAAGQIANDDFVDQMPITHDPAIDAIWDTAWYHYSDTTKHTLTGSSRLHPDIKRMWIRWLLFLDSDCRYVWSQISGPGNDPGARASGGLVSWLRQLFGGMPVSARNAEFEGAGHYPVWPFASQKDYRYALRNPRRLGSRA